MDKGEEGCPGPTRGSIIRTTLNGHIILLVDSCQISLLTQHRSNLAECTSDVSMC